MRHRPIEFDRAVLFITAAWNPGFSRLDLDSVWIGETRFLTHVSTR
jgi:hypothetical protein